MHTSTPDPPPDGPRWADQPTVLAELARLDLSPPDAQPDTGQAPDPTGASAQVRPTFVAFAGEQALFLATVRPFPSSGHHEPILELGALAMALHADRLAVSLGGRAWSTQDPIPPVVAGVGDLRQRVLVIHLVDATTQPADARTILHPILDGHHGPRLGRCHVEEQAAGWVVQAMQLMVEHPLPTPAEPAELIEQVVRCEGAGHTLAWGPATFELVRAARRLVGPDGLAGEAA